MYHKLFAETPYQLKRKRERNKKREREEKRKIFNPFMV
jgi:hypothetical protein